MVFTVCVCANAIMFRDIQRDRERRDKRGCSILFTGRVFTADPNSVMERKEKEMKLKNNNIQ